MKHLLSFLGRCLLAVGLLSMIFVACQKDPVSSPNDLSIESDWKTLSDEHFKFAIQYPQNWIVNNPARPSEEMVGRTLQFYNGDWKNQAPHSNAVTKIEVGVYFVEKAADMSLEEWSKTYDTYHDAIPADEITILSEKSETIGGQSYFSKSAISPMAPYSYVNVSHGNMVWFFWANSTDETVKEALRYMATTVNFAADAPKQLTDLFGTKFQAQPLAPIQFSNQGKMSVAVDYDAPVSVTADIKCGSANAELCNGTHKNAAKYAIDIAVGSGTYVKTAAYSIVKSFSWSNTGYGNLIKMRDGDNNLAYYAHLSTIYYTHLYSLPSWQAIWKSQGAIIAKSGDTGAGAAHLHFHVQTSGWQAYHLWNVSDVSLWNNYSDCNKAAWECSSTFECKCGQVH